ncbi:hypothetical protein BC831DRAFT_548635 [Entophlyctis helioformis]|nr:hypothetical protein BC831DRAFT_548635 [Entophlyctis helioformis]
MAQLDQQHWRSGPARCRRAAAAAADDDDDDFGDFDEFAAAEPAAATAAVSSLAVPAPASGSSGVAPTGTDAFDALLAASGATEADPAQEKHIATLLGSLGIQREAGADLEQVFRTIERVWTAPDVSLFCSASADLASGLLMAAQDTDAKAGTSGNTAGQLSKPQPLSIHPAFADASWALLWSQLAKDSIGTANVHDKFRWRRSLIRKSFLGSVNISFDADETMRPLTGASNNALDAVALTSSRASALAASGASGSGASTAATASSSGASKAAFASGPAASTIDVDGGKSNGSTTGFSKPPPGVYDQMDPREAELIEAKRLCDITEDEMRRHTTEEIRELVKALMSHHSKMQEQANYWLDSKEQLIMDAEMHNKMIASLVQYAQQQQVGPKGGAASNASAGAKKKRFGSLGLK